VHLPNLDAIADLSWNLQTPAICTQETISSSSALPLKVSC